jgi:hypothetical protein
MKPLRVVSVSLGSRERDVDLSVTLLGRVVRIERRGTDGSVAAARALVAELDGTVDAIGLGGLDLYLQWAGRRYYFREARAIASAARTTPVVCGAGLKDSLERRTVAALDASIGWSGRRVLLSAGLDRFGMAEALARHGADVRFGDLMFALGIPWSIRDVATLDRVARLLAPLVTQLPVSWIYPTGQRQGGAATTERFARHYRAAEVVAGDWHLIRRYAPDRMEGAVILTNTTTPADVAFLRARGAARLITTTPRFEGRSLATNLLEAAFVALRGPDLGREGYLAILDEIGYAPSELTLA